MAGKLEAFQKNGASFDLYQLSENNIDRLLHDAKLGVCLDARNHGALQLGIDSTR